MNEYMYQLEETSYTVHVYKYLWMDGPHQDPREVLDRAETFDNLEEAQAMIDSLPENSSYEMVERKLESVTRGRRNGK